MFVAGPLSSYLVIAAIQNDWQHVQAERKTKTGILSFLNKQKTLCQYSNSHRFLKIFHAQGQYVKIFWGGRDHLLTEDAFSWKRQYIYFIKSTISRDSVVTAEEYSEMKFWTFTHVHARMIKIHLLFRQEETLKIDLRSHYCHAGDQTDTVDPHNPQRQH